MSPKKILLVLTAIAAVVGVTIPATSDAGGYKSRVEGTCGYCNKAVYTYYKPIGYDSYGKASYNWVISHHTTCRNNYNRSQQARTVTTVRSRPAISINFGSSPYYGGYGRSSYGYSRGGYGYGGYSGYRSYGRGGYCR